MAPDLKENESIWIPFDQALVQEVNGRVPEKKRRPFSWVLRTIIPLALCLAAGIGVMLPLTLSSEARISIWVFTVAIILWSATKLNVAFVALAALLLLVLTGAAPQEKLFESLASDVVWLMIGAFVLGEAIQTTGLARRLTSLVLWRTKTVNGIFWKLTFALIPLTFLIPATSGRAAVMLPVYKAISVAATDQRITRALSLLLASVILVVTITSLIGAGSHLVANDLLQQQTGKRISFLDWIVYGLPFGVMAAILNCYVIMRMFLSPELRIKAISIGFETKPGPLNTAEMKTLIIAAIMVLMWVTEQLHGVKIAVVAIAGAVGLTLPEMGVLPWKQAVKSISWNLIIFIGTALMLGQLLIDTGAAGWLVEMLFTITGISSTRSVLLVLVFLIFISLTSHIYITSHTARAAALIPGLLYLADSLQINPVAVMFIGTVGMDYCLTFPVSSKAMLMFQDTGHNTFHPTDLLRLSAVMLVVHFVLMLFFYFTYWRWVGLQFIR